MCICSRRRAALWVAVARGMNVLSFVYDVATGRFDVPVDCLCPVTALDNVLMSWYSDLCWVLYLGGDIAE